ncbi:GxxExxY protein [Desulfurispirillum indicum]|uniref:GxxExxY protein n=1 Tax=Desulfurispirillum indicum (strain ATCC BAA-1389 / DSM 22839 / S5) TaxID=653733 RepID=E6W6N3_DESIS|nr:GxxExxY protein [Desulfurispirillum indicum]ADU65033.1 hypothetical protein Selin_0277 [Desulfurispirillum indicum S5]UCZ56934.1 GxxExxY protein [Desulfurispirillum indicum]
MLSENALGKIIVDTAVKLHQNTGPGLLESVYEVILAQLLTEQGLQVERQVSVPIHYNGRIFDEGFRADIVVNNMIILELKSVECIQNTHKKQLLTYLRLTDKKLGFLLNFGEALMKDGIVRIVNGLTE